MTAPVPFQIAGPGKAHTAFAYLGYMGGMVIHTRPACALRIPHTPGPLCDHTPATCFQDQTPTVHSGAFFPSLATLPRNIIIRRFEATPCVPIFLSLPHLPNYTHRLPYTRPRIPLPAPPRREPHTSAAKKLYCLVCAWLE